MWCGTYADIVIEWLRRKEGIVGPVSEVSTEAFSPIRGHDAPWPSMNQTHSKPAWIFLQLPIYNSTPTRHALLNTTRRGAELTHFSGEEIWPMQEVSTSQNSLGYTHTIDLSHTYYLSLTHIHLISRHSIYSRCNIFTKENSKRDRWVVFGHTVTGILTHLELLAVHSLPSCDVPVRGH